MPTETQLSKWGNSLAVRIPRAIADGARLQEGDRLSLALNRDGDIVLHSARRRYKLDELVSRISSENRHQETDWGRRFGREIW